MKASLLSPRIEKFPAPAKGMFRRADIVYFIKLTSLSVALYYFNTFYIGLTDSKGLVYSAFCHDHLDYISWLRASILYTANGIARSFGLASYIADSFTLKVAHGPGVVLGFPCLGYGVMGFWIAFITAQEGSLQKKLTWSGVGILLIWLTNCWRIALLLIALNGRWNVNRYLNHHEAFNIVVYCFVLLMGLVYHMESKNESVQH